MALIHLLMERAKSMSNPATQYLDAIPAPAILVGPDARIRAANGAALKLTPAAAEDRPFIMVFRQPSLSAAVEECLRTQAKTQTVFFTNDDAHDLRFDVTCAYVEGSEIEGVVIVFRDVTPEEHAGQIRRDFVANVSHELRTPLTALLGFIETLQGPARNDEGARQRFLDIMSAEAERMNRLVGDLLSLSRVEDEARMRPTEAVEIVNLVGVAAQNLRQLAENSSVELVTELGEDEVMIPADADQLMQVFMNLIENAIKYGGTGTRVRVTLRETARDMSLRKPAVIIDVVDNGPGIDPVHIPRLTERFYRIDSHRSREMGGTGLGLAIVKHIVNRHRGRLRVTSEPGKGSIFSVILPKS